MGPIELDPRPLAGSAAAAAVGVLLLAATWYVGNGWLKERVQAFERARGQLSRVASQYRNASDDQAVYERYAARFRDMKDERGWIGPEQRLSWIEALRAINRELKLPVLSYDIAERGEVPLDGVPFDTANLTLHRTPMVLEIGALHEGDLVVLLEQLATRGAGLLAPGGCEINRARPAGAIRYDVRTANLDIRCALDWYTLEIEPEQDA